MTCKYLRIVANERFITRSRFLYTQQKIGISLSVRPPPKYLYERNILPGIAPSLTSSFNINHFLLANSLQKSFKQDTLAKQLNRRPSKEELKRVNILQEDNISSLVKERVKEFHKENISNVLAVVTNSFKLQKQIQKEISSSFSKHSNRESLPPTPIPTPIEVSDEFTSLYLKFWEHLGRGPRNKANLGSEMNRKVQHKDKSLMSVLNHIDTETVFSKKESRHSYEFESQGDQETMTVRGSKVWSRKQYFEMLNQAESVQNSPPSSRCASSSSSTGWQSDTAGEEMIQECYKKPSRTVFRAQVVSNNVISYEKVY